MCAEACDHNMGKSSQTGRITWEPNPTPSLAATRKLVSGSQALSETEKRSCVQKLAHAVSSAAA